MAKNGHHKYYGPNFDLYIGNAGRKGLGVFTDVDIPAYVWIEVCPLVLLKDPWAEELDKFYYEWDDETCGLAMGLGSFYNHAVNPNATFMVGCVAGYSKKPTVGIKALGRIKRGTEITINYNGTPGDRTPWEF